MKVQTPLPHSDHVVVVSQRTVASPDAEVEVEAVADAGAGTEGVGGDVVVADGDGEGATPSDAARSAEVAKPAADRAELEAGAFEVAEGLKRGLLR